MVLQMCMPQMGQGDCACHHEHSLSVPLPSSPCAHLSQGSVGFPVNSEVSHASSTSYPSRVFSLSAFLIDQQALRKTRNIRH